MSVRKAEAVWNGTLREGNGRMKGTSGAFETDFSFATRFEEKPGTNPEELIGAALAGCFSMALSADLERGGHKAERVSTTAAVHLERTDAGPTITRIELTCEAKVPGIDDAAFQEQANKTKSACPVSRALTAEIELTATLVN